jgi:hypothetical protein
MTNDELLQDLLRRVHGRHHGAMRGTVTNAADPDGRHRVKIYIPALDIETGWAYPLTLGGGSKDRGLHVVPAKGGDVVVWFEQGDPVDGCAFYLAGWWGDASTAETPKAIASADKPEQVQVLQVGLVQIVIDEREGKRSVRISDEQDPPTSIEWDLEKRGIVIDAVSAVVVRAKGGIHLEAPNITLNGRRVKGGTEQI